MRVSSFWSTLWNFFLALSTPPFSIPAWLYVFGIISNTFCSPRPRSLLYIFRNNEDPQQIAHKHFQWYLSVDVEKIECTLLLVNNPAVIHILVTWISKLRRHEDLNYTSACIAASGGIKRLQNVASSSVLPKFATCKNNRDTWFPKQCLPNIVTRVSTRNTTLNSPFPIHSLKCYMFLKKWTFV